jgi:threonylcarbamoyladenosine tRNA methylthiotransferase MtaB
MNFNVKTVYLASVGCRTNQDEIAVIGRRLTACGLRIVDNVKDADIVVVNTCAVTGHTETKTRRLIQSISRRAPDARILVTGCMAQLDPLKFKNLSGVSWIVGNTYKSDVVSIIESKQQAVVHSCLFPAAPLVLDASLPVVSDGAWRTRYSVKIQEGCDSKCAYCIVPSLRGPSRCADLSSIVSACSKACDAGMREIVLTGTHIGHYRDPQTSSCLEDLIGKILTCGRENFRLRLSSLNPGDISGALCDLIAQNPYICDHLHISAQSLCPDVLTGMNRSHKEIETCFERIERLRIARPWLAVGMDLITGFPGETEPMFRMTLERLEKWNIAYAHIFRFSRRDGTPAANAPGQISEQVKTRRSGQMRDAVMACRKRFVARQAGVTHTILVEQENPAAGLSSNYLRIVTQSAEVQRNSWMKVRIDGFDEEGNFCRGQMLQEKAGIHG